MLLMRFAGQLNFLLLTKKGVNLLPIINSKEARPRTKRQLKKQQRSHTPEGALYLDCFPSLI